MPKFYKHFQQYPFTAIPVFLSLALVLLTIFKYYIGPQTLVFFGICCLLLYITSIISFILVLTPGKRYLGEHTEEIGAILLAVMWPAIIIGLFSVGWNEFPNQFSNNLPEKFKQLSSSFSSNAVYISAITFTSTGYGDFVPVEETGRWYAIIEAFIGHIHAAVFFAVLFSRIERWRNSRSNRSLKKVSLFTRREEKRRTTFIPSTFVTRKNKNRV